jgi:hypothetical protein
MSFVARQTCSAAATADHRVPTAAAITAYSFDIARVVNAIAACSEH